MDIKKLRKYKYNVGRLKRIDDRIDYLCNKDIEVVSGKVVGSMSGFPYTEVRTTVQMYQPDESDKVNDEIRKKQVERILVMGELEEVESYINGITDPEIKEIFEMSFIQGITQQNIANTISIDRSRISRRISDYIKRTQSTK